MLHSSCLMHPYYLFQFTPDRILRDPIRFVVLGDVQAFMMTCVVAHRNSLSSDDGSWRGLGVPGSGISVVVVHRWPLQFGRATSQFR